MPKGKHASPSSAKGAAPGWWPDHNILLKTGQKIPLQCSFGNLMEARDEHNFWIVCRSPLRTDIALRICWDPEGIRRVKRKKLDPRSVGYEIEGGHGRYTIVVEVDESRGALLHFRTKLRPSRDFDPVKSPKDLFIIRVDGNSGKKGVKGSASCEGPLTAFVWLRVGRKRPTSFLYFQNFTSLADYAEQTRSSLEAAVSVNWPVAGFSRPEGQRPLEKGREWILSDTSLVIQKTVTKGDFEKTTQFADALAAVYLRIKRPETAYYDWPATARKTIQALRESTGCSRKIDGLTYYNAYLGSFEKPPESMVQCAILLPMLNYQLWNRSTTKVAENLNANLPTFFDEKAGTIVRWLPSGEFRKDERSEEESRGLMDSWYLYHVAANLGIRAVDGDGVIRELFLKTVDYCIRGAHQFNYDWPVFYRIDDFKVEKAETEPGKGGESDVPGMHVYVMMLAYQLRHENRYLDEAREAAERLKGVRLDVVYQTNNTVFSAFGLALLWRETKEEAYLELSQICLANVVSKFWIGDAAYGFSRAYSTFLGLVPLHDAPYLAAFEEGEALKGIIDCLKVLRHRLWPSLNLILCEYAKYLASRGRFYFPEELPPESISTSPKEGKIRTRRWIPLEDLRTGWELNGQVGQEVYGSAFPLIMTTCMYLRMKEVPFFVFCEYPILDARYIDHGRPRKELFLGISGSPELKCKLRLVQQETTSLDLRIQQISGGRISTIKAVPPPGGALEVTIPGGCPVCLSWQKSSPFIRRKP